MPRKHPRTHHHYTSDEANWYKRKTDPRVAGCILAALTLIMLITATGSSLRDWNIKQHGTRSDAVITGIAHCRSRSGIEPTIMYTVQFLDGTGTQHSEMTSWCDEPGRYLVGDHLGIAYDPDNLYYTLTAADLTLVDSNLHWALLADVLAALAIGIATLIIWRRYRHPQLRTYSHHPLARRVRYARYG